MSWNVSIPLQPFGSFIGAVHVAQLPANTSSTPELTAQWEEQLAAAKNAVSALLHTNVPVGHDDAQWSASMGGHANHLGGDTGMDYTTEEFITVTLRRVPAKQVTPQHAPPD